jgi:Flp pilus assembly protein TadG
VRLPRPLDFLRALLRDPRGGTAVIFAIAAPSLALLIAGAIDLSNVNSDRSAMQDAADSTALAMAKQLGVGTTTGIVARATDYADAQLGTIATNDSVNVKTTVSSDNTSVTVVITGSRGSFFGNLLPPGGWSMNAQATASNLGKLPLCVLSSGTGSPSSIEVQNSSLMTAGGCLVQSNGDLSVDSGASLTAGLAQASGAASGPITPTAQTGAPTIPDPFASTTFNAPLLGICTPLDLVYDIGVNILLPGTHCGNITVRKGASVILLPGEHYFTHGLLQMDDNSSLTGSNVVMVFDDTASFAFNDTSTISLSGRQSGSYAGFVVATTRTNTKTFTISSTSAKKLEGTIYVPSSTLQISGVGNKVADQSAWTVIVAEAIQMTGSPNLVVNANYASSSVPVPGGVGSNYTSGGKVTLSK